MTTPTGTWTAMGTTARVLLHAPGAEAAAGLAQAKARVAELEARWSRFRPDSDVGRANAAGGQPVPVHPETMALLEQAEAWWRATGGRFDPTVLRALEAAGYDRDRALGHGTVGRGAPAPGFGQVGLDVAAGTVTLPAGVGIDLGGIGKGRAVDLLVEELGALDGGLVDLGGDLRVWGESPEGTGWGVEVEDLRTGAPLAVLGLAQGAVATSSVLRRAWADRGRHAHHLIDPATGRPATGEVVSVTVVAAETAPAEVLAKAALLTGRADEAVELLTRHEVAGFVVPREGRARPVGGVDALCWTRLEERC